MIHTALKRHSLQGIRIESFVLTSPNKLKTPRSEPRQQAPGIPTADQPKTACVELPEGKGPFLGIEPSGFKWIADGNGFHDGCLIVASLGAFSRTITTSPGAECTVAGHLNCPVADLSRRLSNFSHGSGCRWIFSDTRFTRINGYLHGSMVQGPRPHSCLRLHRLSGGNPVFGIGKICYQFLFEIECSMNCSTCRGGK